MKPMRHIISILMENETGALSRLAGLFPARGPQTPSPPLAPTEKPPLSPKNPVKRRPPNRDNAPDFLSIRIEMR